MGNKNCSKDRQILQIRYEDNDFHSEISKIMYYFFAFDMCPINFFFSNPTQTDTN